MTARQTDKIFTEKMLIYERNLHTQKNRALSKLGAEKMGFLPKPDIHTYRDTDRQTDISVYRVALLLKTNMI